MISYLIVLPLNFITFRVKISKYEMGREVSKNIQSIARNGMAFH